MINNRMISSATIVAKVIADLDLREDQIRITDIREWIMEGVLKIGAVQQYDNKTAILPVIGHQAALPCDLYKLGQVAFSTQNCGGWMPMRKSTSSFGVDHDKCCGRRRPKMFVKDVAMLPLVKNMFNLTTDREALDKLNEDTRFSNDLQYTTKPGFINTNVPMGFVKIQYYAIYTDEDSMPMIPDLESYKEAIYWYVTMKLMYPKKLKGEISQGDYYDIRNSYNFYRKQAYAEAMMPGVDDVESIKNDWNKLYPEIDDHSLFFSTTGEEQIIYNQNR